MHRLAAFAACIQLYSALVRRVPYKCVCRGKDNTNFSLRKYAENENMAAFVR